MKTHVLKRIRDKPKKIQDPTVSVKVLRSLVVLGRKLAIRGRRCLGDH